MEILFVFCLIGVIIWAIIYCIGDLFSRVSKKIKGTLIDDLYEISSYSAEETIGFTGEILKETRSGIKDIADKIRSRKQQKFN